MQIYGSRKCIYCNQKYNWTGMLENRASEKMQGEILKDRDLHFAKFFKSADNDKVYHVKVICPICRETNTFEYIRMSFSSE
ncbi:hypothetical protein D1872_154370 [compost metagenome]